MRGETPAARPSSMTLMAGPIDARVNPTKVNELANSKPIAWFERNLIATVPVRYPGAFRRVYPGFVQLAAFMSMNIERHLKAHRELYDLLARGEHEKAEATKAFYDEYFAVLDLTAEFYLDGAPRGAGRCHDGDPGRDHAESIHVHAAHIHVGGQPQDVAPGEGGHDGERRHYYGAVAPQHRLQRSHGVNVRRRSGRDGCWRTARRSRQDRF
jgi:hypothetical protein